MAKRKKYISFYQLKWRYCIPYVHSYGMMCHRSWLGCFKLGLRHLRKNGVIWFRIDKSRPKKHLFGS